MTTDKHAATAAAITTPDARSLPARRSGPLPSFIGWPASALYSAVIASRNARFDSGRGVIQIDRPVISVGNLSVGGTGKTPTVIAIARWLREAGRWPCVAMRGYAAAAQGSDEALEYRRSFPDLPMVIQADRAEGLLELFAEEAGNRVDSVLLDDGFQHRRIARQMDIVLIDATRSPFDDHLLPHGWLREPVKSVRRAHAIVVTHAESVSSPGLLRLRERIAEYAKTGAILATSEHVWNCVHAFPPGSRANDDSHSAAGQSQPLTWLSGQRVFVCCAIGNPAAFISRGVQAGCEVVGTLILRDHDPFDANTIAKLLDRVRASKADALVVTRKDWVKLGRVRPEAWPCPIVVPDLSVRFRDGEATLRATVTSMVADFAVDE